MVWEWNLVLDTLHLRRQRPLSWRTDAVYPVNWGLGQDWGVNHKDADEGLQEADLRVPALGWCLAARGAGAMFSLVSWLLLQTVF